MPQPRSGWSDTYTDGRLTQLTGTTYPAAPASLYIALLRGLPQSDGSDATGLEILRVGPVTFTAPASSSSGEPGHRYIQPAAGVSITPAGPGDHINASAWALYSVANGGTPIYVGQCAAALPVGVATTLPASSFRITAEQPH